MGEAARVYAEQLQRYRHGHPLWWPEHTQGPDGRKREIDIGDVGYIDSDGAFHPLFNVTYPADDERNAGSLPADDFVPLRYSTSAIEIKENFLAPGPVHSQSVTSRSVDVGLAANGQVLNAVGVALSYSFECGGTEGAFLMLWDGATKTVVEKDGQEFERYMINHHDSWCEYARNKLGLPLKNEDIVLVRGFIKNSIWTIATFHGDRSHAQEVTVSGKLAPLVDVKISYSSRKDVRCSPLSPRSGPLERIKGITNRPFSSTLAPDESGDDGDECHLVPKDQCLFLNYYKIKRRWFGAPKEVKAAAGSGHRDDTQGRGGIHEVDVALEAGSSNQDIRDLLDNILEYILEVSNAELAITSHNDLQNFTLDGGGSWQTSFMSRLRSSRPDIVVDNGVGRLSCNSDTKSVVDTGPRSTSSAKADRNEYLRREGSNIASFSTPTQLQGPSTSSRNRLQGMDYHTYVHIDSHMTGMIIPQQVYRTSASPYPTFENITFRQGQILGVGLHNVLSGRQNDLSDGHTRPYTTTTSTKIRIRILWPGYDEFSKDIKAKEHTKGSDPITKSELAVCIAQVVRAFYDQNVGNRCTIETWSVQHIRFERLRLLELRQVSTGSWQPLLLYDPPGSPTTHPEVTCREVPNPGLFASGLAADLGLLHITSPPDPRERDFSTYNIE